MECTRDKPRIPATRLFTLIYNLQSTIYNLRFRMGGAIITLKPNRIATKLSRVALGLWVGGLVAMDFVETPARFRTTEIDRN